LTEPAGGYGPAVPTASEQLEQWLQGEEPKTLGGLVATVEEKSFALLFILLMGVPALPLPTGGATHLFEIIAMLLALQLIAGRDRIWLPARWSGVTLAGGARERFVVRLTSLIRRLERCSKPRMAFLFGHRASSVVYGLLVLGGAAAAFVAPPFTGLDTLPSLGVVLLSVAWLMEDAALAFGGLVLALIGVALEIALGAMIVDGVQSLV
jgi:hypothetical protein